MSAELLSVALTRRGSPSWIRERAAARIVADEAARFDEWRRQPGAVPLLARLLRARASVARPSAAARRALHLEILRLKARAAA